MSTPRSIFSRAVRPNLISLAAMFVTPEFELFGQKPVSHFGKADRPISR
jgi:hypothetical protein